jgi:hypothetical protein
MPLNSFRKSQVVINGTTDSSGNVVRGAGYLNWVADHLRKNLRAATDIAQDLSRSDIKLTYSLGGYSSKNYLTILGEQSSPTATINGILIPDDDYDIFLDKSQPVAQIVYSAVVVRKTNLGYSVSGYDTARPYFTIIPSQATNNSYSISIDGVAATIFNDYENFSVDMPYESEFSSVQQVVDFLISYQRYLEFQGILFNDTSASLKDTMDFALSAREFITWHLQGWKENSLIVLSPLADMLKVNLPFGTPDQIQNSKLKSCVLDQNYNVINVKDLDVNRYGNFASIYSKSSTTIGLVVLDIISYQHQLIFKNRTQFNDIIYQPELGNRQSRLKINGTITDNWTGTLDAPGFVINLNTVAKWIEDQNYLVGDIVEYKTFYYVALESNSATTFNSRYWQQVDYSQVNQTLLPNLTNLAAAGRDYYNFDNTNLNETIDNHARGLIGYRQRQYFNELGLDNVTQTKFYQGFIKNKGTLPAVTALQYVSFGKLTNTVKIYEDWAFRVGEYGGINSSKSIEINLQEQYFSINPGVAVIANRLGESELGSQLVTVQGLYKKPDGIEFVKAAELRKQTIEAGTITAPDDQTIDLGTIAAPSVRSVDFGVFAQIDGQIFDNNVLARDNLLYREDVILTAGYVDQSDVNATVFDIQDLAADTLLPDIYPGYTIWCALDYTRDWNVFRVTETGLTFKEFNNLLDQQLMIEFNSIHELVIGDVVAVKNFSTVLDGFYRVTAVPAIDTIVVIATKSLQGFSTVVGDDTGLFFKLISLRFNNIEDSVRFTPQDSWRENEKIWIDNYGEPGKWAVLEKHSTWATTSNSIYSIDEPLTGFGLSTAVDFDGNYVVTGTNSNKVLIYTKDSLGAYSKLQTLSPQYVGRGNFGTRVTYIGSLLVVSDPGFNKTGAVIVYQKNAAGRFEAIQFISPVLSGDPKFGFSAALSNNFLVVGAPGANTIYIYKKETQTKLILSVPLPRSTKVTLPTAINSRDSIIILSDLGDIVSPRTYTISGSDIIFNTVPSTAFSVYQPTEFYKQFQIINDITISGLDDFFGYSLEINEAEDKIYVGAPYADVYDNNLQQFVDNSGRVIMYGLYNDSFQFVEQIEPVVPQLNGEFGASIKAAKNDSALFVGAPGVSFTTSYNSGQVYRFVNLGQTTGAVTSVEFNGSVVGYGSIVINGVVVTVTGNLGNIKSQIDSANIPYINTSINSQILTIKSSSIVDFDKLSVLPGAGTAFQQLGFKFVIEAQVIPNPINRNLSRFGGTIALSENNNQLFVASPRATSILRTIFDNETCYFDSKATVFQDQTTDSGSVCVFEFIKPVNFTNSNLGSYIFGQQLEATTVSGGDLFGSSLAVAKTTIFVGAPGDDIQSSIDNRGRILQFKNPGIDSLWAQIKTKQLLVDTDKISRVFLYNKKNNTIVTPLDIVDPVKGHILGTARQYLDYVESQDPADYNRSSGIDVAGVSRINNYNYWSDQYVGRYWLDTSHIRFVDYEQQDLIYRKSNWNRLFPGSEVRVYQWVESDVLPAEYSNYYSGTPKYVDDESYSIVYTVDKNTNAIQTRFYFWVRALNTKPDFKELSTTVIEEYISNPKSAVIPYIAFYSPSAFGLYNSDSYIDADNTILHIGYDLSSNENVIHSEFQLVQENSSTSALPQRVLKKLVDSLSGINLIGDTVPDPLLPVSQRYGLGIRPRQTMVIDRLAALEVFVKTANEILMYLPTASRIIGTDFFYKDTTHDATKFWRKSDRIVEGFDSNTPIQHSVSKFADIKKINYAVGTVIKVTNDGEPYTIIKITASGFDILAQENGTITLLPTIYQTANPNRAIRKVLESVFYQLFIEDYAVHANKLFFALTRYLLREQKSLDWVFKTSFITVDHVVTQFEQWPNYQPDNTTYLTDFLNEAKPYHTKIREYRPQYNGITVGQIGASDFDLPSYYDFERSNFHTPSGESADDADLWRSREYYQDWYNNYKLGVTALSIADAGSGYLTPPLITVSGGGGSGARVRAKINAGKIVDFIFDSPGTGYTTIPTVTVTRNGTEPLLDFHLIAAALSEKVAGKVIDPILDAAFTSRVGSFQLGDLNNTGVITALDAALALSYSNNQLFDNAFDLARVSAKMAGIYNYLITHNGKIGLAGNAVLKAKITNSTTRNFYIQLLFDRVWYQATNGDPGFDVNLFDDDNFDDGDPAFNYQTALDRVRQYYTGRPGQPGIDYGQLFNGVDFPGYNLRSIDFSVAGGYDGTEYDMSSPAIGYDEQVTATDLTEMTVYSTYRDLLLGTRAEDIIFDGGKFIDVAHSHAPEELVPGIVFDTLEIRVFHKFADSSVPNVAFRMFKNLLDQYTYYRMAASNATALTQPLLITDTVISVVSAAALDAPSPNSAKPGIVFINGERITYFERDLVNNQLGRIRRGTAGTGTPQVHTVGSAVVGAGSSQYINDAHNNVWYDLAVGLEKSTSETALFLKDQAPVAAT